VSSAARQTSSWEPASDVTTETHISAGPFLRLRTFWPLRHSKFPYTELSVC